MGAKLAGMAARTYAVESSVYRIGGADRQPRRGSRTARARTSVRAALEELAVECSIAKVFASEALDLRRRRAGPDPRRLRLSRGVPGGACLPGQPDQPHLGGNERDQPAADPGDAAQARDDGAARPARARHAGRRRRCSAGAGSTTGIVDEEAAVANARTATLLLAGAAVQRFGTALEEQQELLAGLADLTIDAVRAGGVELRAGQAAADAPRMAETHRELARLVIERSDRRAELPAGRSRPRRRGRRRADAPVGRAPAAPPGARGPRPTAPRRGGRVSRAGGYPMTTEGRASAVVTEPNAWRRPPRTGRGCRATSRRAGRGGGPGDPGR